MSAGEVTVKGVGGGLPGWGLEEDDMHASLLAVLPHRPLHRPYVDNGSAGKVVRWRP